MAIFIFPLDVVAVVVVVPLSFASSCLKRGTIWSVGNELGCYFAGCPPSDGSWRCPPAPPGEMPGQRRWRIPATVSPAPPGEMPGQRRWRILAAVSPGLSRG